MLSVTCPWKVDGEYISADAMVVELVVDDDEDDEDLGVVAVDDVDIF